MPHFAASDLGLHSLPMSHKKDARLIWVDMAENHVKVGRGGLLKDYAVIYLPD